LDAAAPPDGDEDIGRWLYGICRHKIVDWFRRMRREVPRDLQATEEAVPAESEPTSALDLIRWARKELPPGKENEQTLEWMLREGEGEKLETIAAEANLPAPRVRQRVSRLRRYYKMKWAEAVAIAALVLIALAVGFALRRKQDQVAPRPEPVPVQPSAVPTAPPAPPQALPAISTQPQPVPAPSDSTDVVPPAPSASFDAKPAPTSIPTKPLGKPTRKVFDSGGSSSLDSQLTPPPMQLPPDPSVPQQAPASSAPNAKAPRQAK
jgi:hypothetical protein